MRKRKPIILLLLAPFASFGQGPTNQRVLLENSILSGSFGPEMNLFQDTEGDSAHYSLQMIASPGSDPQSLIYSSALWYGGISDDQLYMTASMYDSPEIDDPCYSGFGPISEAYGPVYQMRYNRVWLVDQSDIENHISQFDSPGYVVPENLASYPGNGRSEFGESHLLLPFVDANDNGIYEPELGDHPKIRGDRCVTWVVNDASNGAEGRPQIETILQAYLYTEGPEELLQTLFVNAQLRNRSDRDYTDFSLGVFVDADVNWEMKNRIGCDPYSNYAYTYSPYDFNPDSWISDYGIPSNVATFFPEDDMHSHMLFSNGNDDNGRPQDPDHFYHYLNARWKNGQPLTYGGNGFAPGNGNNPDITTQFMFPDFIWAIDGGGWSDYPALPANDRTQVLSIAPQDFDAGEALCFHYAFVASADTHATDALNIMDDKIDVLQTWWDTHADTECMDPDHPLSTGELDAAAAGLGLYPNPTSGLLRLDGLPRTDAQQIQVADLSGRVLISATLSAGQSLVDVRALPSGMYLLCLPGRGAALPFVRE